VLQVLGSDFRISGLEFGIYGRGSKVWVKVPRFRVQVTSVEPRVKGLGCITKGEVLGI